MSLILSADAYNRWLSDESDPRDLLRPFSAKPMQIGPISARVNKPENNESSLLDPVVSSAV
jgi:putative SOS response-associated peptidase YedK